MDAELEGVPATDELRERLVRAVLRPHPKVELRPGEWVTDVGPVVDELAEVVVAVVAEARTEGAVAELEYLSADTAKTLQVWTPSDLNERAAALRGVGNQKVGVTVDDLALDEMDGNQNAEPRWSANRLEEVLREGLPDQQQKANQKGTEQ